MLMTTSLRAYGAMIFSMHQEIVMECGDLPVLIGGDGLSGLRRRIQELCCVKPEAIAVQQSLQCSTFNRRHLTTALSLL